MVFGFVVEKFDLFLRLAAISPASGALETADQSFGITGLALIGVGTAIFAISTIRFIANAKKIESEKIYTNPETRVELAISALLFLLGCAFFVFLSHAARS